VSDAADMVRRAYDEAWNSGDLEGLLELAHEDIVLRPSGRIVDLQHEYHGHEGIRNYWRDVHAPWDELTIDVAKVVQHGDSVLVLFRFRATARDGMKVDAKFGQCGTLRDGRVLELVAYPDWESAAEAAGLDLDRI
jgi:ketosteroid isomerase-like protein